MYHPPLHLHLSRARALQVRRCSGRRVGWVGLLFICEDAITLFPILQASIANEPLSLLSTPLLVLFQNSPLSLTVMSNGLWSRSSVRRLGIQSSAPSRVGTATTVIVHVNLQYVNLSPLLILDLDR